MFYTNKKITITSPKWHNKNKKSRTNEWGMCTYNKCLLRISPIVSKLHNPLTKQASYQLYSSQKIAKNVIIEIQFRFFRPK